MLCSLFQARGLPHHEALRREGEIAHIPWTSFACWAAGLAGRRATRRIIHRWLNAMPRIEGFTPRLPRAGTPGRVARRPALGETQLARAVQHYLRDKYLGKN